MPDWGEEIAKRLRDAQLAPAEEADIREELRQHLDDRYAELRGHGYTEAEARRSALDELGDDELRQQLSLVRPRRQLEYASWGAGGRAGSREGVRAFWNDLRIGGRLLRRTPGFTLIAALTLALGIGANTTIFSIVNALLLRPIPGIARPDELVLIGRTQGGQGFDTFSYPDYLDYRAIAKRLSGIAAHFAVPAHLSTGGASERVRAGVVSGNYFRVLGVKASAGRLFLPEEDAATGAHPVVVLSYALWHNRFGGDSAILGQRVSINARSYTVIGVAAEGFAGLDRRSILDLFIPISMVGALRPGFDRALGARDAVWLELVGRLSPGIGVIAAESELEGVARRLAKAYPESNTERGAAVATGVGFDPESRKAVRSFTGILLGVVALVLLIACANVANLLLARGAARQHEFAVRASLGASRARLVRQLLAEGLLLSVIGGALGFALGVGAARLMVRLPLFANAVASFDPTPDLRVLAFTAIVAIVSALVFGIPSAFRASRIELLASLKAATPGSGTRRSVLRNGLLVSQLALSIVLLVAAGLFLRTLRALYTTRPGFDTKSVVIATVDVALQGYDEQRGRRFYTDFERRAASLPGVTGVALAYMLPLGGGGWDTRIYPAEIIPAPDDPGLKTDINTVSEGYFSAVHMPIVRGRGFTNADRVGSPPVAVVNEVIARRLWPDADPIGKRFRAGRGGEPVTVIGVVQTAKYRSLIEASRPFFYRPFAQVYQSPMTLHVATDGDPRVLIPALRQLARALDEDLPVYRIQTLGDRLEGSVSLERTAAILVTSYGLLALLLAAVGLYGSMAYMVARRTREIGIRMALGARAGLVVRQVLGEALLLASVGAGIGIVIAIPSARLLRNQLFGVSPGDPVTFLLVTVALVMVAVGAALSPAWKATRVDPVVALRTE
jgi:predicted permease